MAPGSRLQELTAKYMQNPRRFFVPLANEYRVSGDLDRAIALCREHLPAQPGHMSGHIVLGRAYFEKGDQQAARDVFLTSVSLDDENLIALRHLGDIARGRADVAEARSWYARVLDADPENREIEQLLRSLDVTAAAPSDAEPIAVPATAAPDEPAVGVDPVRVDEVPLGIGAEAPADTFGDLTSALADPTPPGLRAILGEDAGPAFDADLVRFPDAPPAPAARPLETFDLSTLGASLEAELEDDADVPPASIAAPTAAEAFGITVEDGGGFAFSDLDELVDPAVAGTMPDTLPPVEEADFSRGVETPPELPAQPQADDLLSRPVFGALASFASWRTAQERETPAAVPSQPLVDAVPPTIEAAAASEDAELFWQSETPDAAPTAPEFVTETMAALYAQQGFTRQALDVYRTLLERNPHDAGLTSKMLELEAQLNATSDAASLDADADKALSFGTLDDSTSDPAAVGSMLEEMYEVSPPADQADEVDPFGAGWSPESDASAAGGDDWFADVTGDDALGIAGDTEVGIFGFAIDGLGNAEVGTSTGTADEAAFRPMVALASVLGGAAVAAADESAADMLAALAGQMVGRLPKEPPTLPVPEVLELPSAVAADEATGASPAPLLSFDRFFSGSGSPPRPRVDTPVRPAAMTPRDLPSVPPLASPSLSPTFGGVPVIPPPQPSAAPTWAGFDQFVPPPRPAPAPPAPPSTGTPTPTGAFWTPAAVPVIPSTPTPASTPASAMRPVTPPATPAQPTPVAPPAPVAEEATEDPRRSPPSDFHRWLEGLS